MVFAFLAAISWGLNAHFIKLGMRSDNAYHALFIRAAFSVPILLAIVWIWKGWDGFAIYLETPTVYYIVASATLVIIGDVLLLYALSKYTINIVVPITSVYPLFTTIILIITGTETIGTGIIVGTLIIVSGIILVTSGDLSGTFSPKVILLGLGSALSWGSSVVLLRVITNLPGTDAFGITGVRMLLIGIVGLTIHYMSPDLKRSRAEKTTEQRKKSTFYMMLSGVIGWVVGASLFTYSIQLIGAAIPTPISATNPVIASLIGLKLGLETLSRKQFIGIVLSVIGVIIVII